jgi:hypothetical protein
MQSKRALYFNAILYVILMLVAAFFLFFAFVGGIIGPLLTGNYLLLIGGVFFFLLFVLFGALAKKYEWAWQKLEESRGIKRKSFRENLRESSSFIIITLATITIGVVSEEYFISFPSKMSPALAQEILKSILTVDGIMIGFAGIVLAQFLSAIHSKGNILYEQIAKHRNDESVLSEINSEIDRLSRIRLTAIGAVFYSLMPILASFMISLSKLPLTENPILPSPRALLFDPVLALVVGVSLFAMVSIQVNLLPKKAKLPSESKTTQTK